MHKRIMSASMVFILLLGMLPISLTASTAGAPLGGTAEKSARHILTSDDPYAQMTDGHASQSRDRRPATPRHGRELRESGSLPGSDRPTPEDGARRYIVKYKDNFLRAAQILNINVSEKLSATRTIESQPIVDRVPTAAGNPGNPDNRADIQWLDSFEVIIFDEPVLPSVFANELRSAGAERYISYIQPDYALGMTSLGLELDGLDNGVAIAEAEQGNPFDAGSDGWPLEYRGAGEEADPSREVAQPEELPMALQETLPNSEPLIVALIDTGVERNHPMLYGQISNDGWNFPADSPDIYDSAHPLEASHGTHVAGLIVSEALQAGASISILPLKVFDRGTAFTSDLLAAIAYAESLGASIVNCSFGSTAENRALYEAIADSGMLFVCAAGNSRKNLSENFISPACYDLPNVVSVVSTNPDSGFSYFSNYGPADIAAQGRDVVSALPGGKAGPMSGTSMAAGTVTGIAAAVGTIAGIEGAADLRTRLLHTADRLDNLAGKVTEGRRANLSNALHGNAGACLSPHPADDYDVDGYNPSASELLELYSQSGGAVQVAAGGYHTLVLTGDGKVWSFGDNTYGQCGIGVFSNCEPISQVIGLGDDIVGIAAGEYHSLALKADGTIWAWGDNWLNQLGDDSWLERSAPVQALGLVNATAIAAGYDSNLATDDGELVVWGGSQYINMETIGYLGGDAMAVGSHHFLATCGDGTAFAFGFCFGGELGLDFNYGYGSGEIEGLADVTALSAGCSHSLAVSGGEVYAWGEQGSPLGLGYTYGDDVCSPEHVDIPANLTAVAAGESHSLAIDDAGMLWAWGDNYCGTLGNGQDGIAECSPVQITGISGVASISAGKRHSVAVDMNGSLHAWGSNEYGQLGLSLSEYVYSDVPVQVSAGGTTPAIPASVKASLHPGLLIVPQAGSATSSAKAVVLDSEGHVIFGQSVTWSLTAPRTGVSIDSNTGAITVLHTAASGAVTIKGTCGSVSCETPLILVETTSPNSVINLDATVGSQFMLSLNGADIASFDGNTYILAYAPDMLKLLDFAVQTGKQATAPGKVAGTPLTIVSHENGILAFTYDKTVPPGKAWTGTMSLLSFKTLRNGTTEVLVGFGYGP